MQITHITLREVNDTLARIDADLTRLIALSCDCPLVDSDARAALQLIEEINELRISQYLEGGEDE